MSRQYQRYFKLTVGGSGVELDLSKFRVRFQITHWESQTPANATAYIYNLARKTEQKIDKEFATMTIEAGYQESHGILFKGDLRQKRTGRENPVDTFLALMAASGDKGDTYAVVNKSLPKGHTKMDVVQECLKALGEHGITKGHITDLGSEKAPRGAALFGNARDILRKIAQGANATFSYQDGKLQMLKNSEFLPGSTVVVNSETGMIGRPEATIEGVVVRMLINPNVKSGTQLKIDEQSINAAAYSPTIGAEANNELLSTIIATDGLYKVIYVDHFGDTRGLPWYTEALCTRADGKGFIAPSIAQRGVTSPVAQAPGGLDFKK